MSLNVELGMDLGEGEVIIGYDSSKSPLGVSLRLTTEDQNVLIEHIDPERLERLLEICNRILYIAKLEECEIGDDEDDDDSDLFEES